MEVGKGVGEADHGADGDELLLTHQPVAALADLLEPEPLGA